MYKIRLLLHLLRQKLTPSERLGLVQYLHNLGWGGYCNDIPECAVKNVGNQLVVANKEQCVTITKSKLKPLLVETPWKGEEPHEASYTCIPGSPQDVEKILDVIDEEVNIVEVKINGQTYQAIQCPTEHLLATAELPYCQHSISLDVVYVIREGEISQKVASRGYRLEVLGLLE